MKAKLEAKAAAQADARRAAGKPLSFPEKHLPKIPVLGPLLLKLYFLWDWVSKTTFYRTIQAVLKYAALLAMFVSLRKLQAAVPFEKDVPPISAIAQPAALKPASNDMLNALGAASTNDELKNTFYLYAYSNGKSAVRVCTDLEKSKFEAITNVGQYSKWDDMDAEDIKKFKANGCVNATTLAFNGGCTDEIEFTGIAEHNFHSVENPKAQRGRCGSPGDTDRLFSNPQPPASDGWLWHYMIRKIDPVDFNPEPLKNVSCTTSTCETAKCSDDACYDSTESCIGFQFTTACGETGQSYNTTIRSSCDTPLGNRLNGGQFSQGYCDCGNNRKVWMCGKYAFDFKCADTCKCNNPTVSNTLPVCSGAGKERCSCNTTVVETGDKPPQWIKDNPQYANTECERSYGRFNTVECDGKTVLSYAFQIQWVVTLFTTATILRIILQLSYMYWACVEDEPRYRILMADQSFLILYFLYNCKSYGIRKVNEALEHEYLQGWPWLLSLLEGTLVTCAVMGAAWGADPFPSLGRGKMTLFLLWVAAFKEIGKLLQNIYETIGKKAYRQVGDRGIRYPFLFCIKSDMPWCIKISQEKFDNIVSATKTHPKTVQVA
jgi:hypothetical protein